MSKTRSTLWRTLLIGVVVALITVACGGDNGSGDGGSATGDTTASGNGSGNGSSPSDRPLVHAVPADFNSLDPANTQGATDQEISSNLYERLLTYKWDEQPDGTLVWDGLEVEPQLAESWEIDGPSITFTLREGVTFYPTGNPLTAEDVRYSFERLTQIAGNGRFQAGVAGIFEPEQIEVIDDLTVRINFQNPAGEPTAIPVSLPSMRFQQFAIIDSVEVKSHATDEDPWAQEWLDNNVAGTGRYYIDQYSPGEEIRLRAVPDHWSGEQPAFEDVIIRITGGADLVALIRGGEVDYAASGLTGRQYDELENAGFQVVRQSTPSIMRIQMAIDKDPFTDPAVRQAMLRAIPYEQIISVAFSGRGERSVAIVNPQDPLSTNDWAVVEYDLDEAAAMLEEAGVDGFEFDLWYSSDISYNEDIALLIADSLSQIGITANLQGRPTLQLIEQYRARIAGTDENMSGMYLHETVIWLDDPETHIDLWGKSDGVANWARLNDPVIDQLHADFRHSSDEDARFEAYAEIQGRMFEAAASNPVIVMGRTVAANPNITGMTFSPDPFARYAYIRPTD